MSDLKAALLQTIRSLGRETGQADGLSLRFTPAECYGRSILSVTAEGRRPLDEEMAAVTVALRRIYGDRMKTAWWADPLATAARNIYWRVRE